MTLILGIDPGSRITGYGVVRDTGRGCEYVASGCIRTGNGPLAERLQIVFRGVSEVIRTHGPVTMGIEQVFMARNADSALKLGQARGAVILGPAGHGLSVAEYAPNLIKKAVVGAGHADKAQVAFMVRRLLPAAGEVSADAADALAVALTHAHSSATAGRSGVAPALLLRRRRR